MGMFAKLGEECCVGSLLQGFTVWLGAAGAAAKQAHVQLRPALSHAKPARFVGSGTSQKCDLQPGCNWAAAVLGTRAKPVLNSAEEDCMQRWRGRVK